MTEKKEIQGKISGQFQTNDKNYLIVEVKSEETPKLFDKWTVNVVIL
ncbi:hypothetical protein [Bacillus pumilus]